MADMKKWIKCFKEVDILHIPCTAEKHTRLFCPIGEPGTNRKGHILKQIERDTSITMKFSWGDFYRPKLMTGVANTKIGSLIAMR